jgi:hypothetical protein
MLFTFRSKASAEFYMLEAHARTLLDLIGKPLTPTGIITAAQIPEAIAAIEAAVARTASAPSPAKDADEDKPREAYRDVALAQRAWPLLEMLRKAQARQADVIWDSR